MEQVQNKQSESAFSEELESYIQQFESASTGQRFLNFLIDNLLMQFGIGYLTGTIVGYFLNNFFPELAYDFAMNSSQFNIFLLSYVISILNYILYYTFCEKLFKGYTLGKLITGTRAIREDGQELSFKDALLRSLSRIVPFEAFSALNGNPWHDTWTKTEVIKAR